MSDPRFLFVTKAGILDTKTGEITSRFSLPGLISERPGGIIVGRNMYELIAELAQEIRRDQGATLRMMSKEDHNGRWVKGFDYWSALYYRFAKVKGASGRYRPNAIKWSILNLELYCEPPTDMTELEDVEGAGRALYALAERRGITVRASPGAFGSALLRASKQWEKGRHAAPWFISEIARDHLPGNDYRLRHGHRTAPAAYYLDQKSSHHSIVASIGLPHPHNIRARGKKRAAEKGNNPYWKGGDLLANHIGLLCAVVECDFIPDSQSHLYPKWALKRGRRCEWIWTPELRLLDRRVRLQYVTAAMTGVRTDPALREYSEWALDLLQYDNHPAIKPALLGAYGMLASRRREYYSNFTLHGRPKPPRATEIKRPVAGKMYRSDIKSSKPSVLQNVIARGVIEAETLTRTLEMARKLEGEGHPVIHIYADGLLTTANQLPFLPNGWRVHAELTHITSPHPNSILSREMVRLPGIPNGRRTAVVRPVAPARGGTLHSTEVEAAFTPS